MGPASGSEIGATGAATSETGGAGGGTARNGARNGSLASGADDSVTTGASFSGCGMVGRTASIALLQSWRTGELVIAGSPSRLRANSAASSSVIAKLFFSIDGAHPAFCVFPEPIPENAASRQSVCPAGVSLTVSSIAELMRQLPVFDDSSASSSSSVPAELPQSRSGALCFGEIANTASSSGVAVSSKLPNASGCALVAIVSGDGRGAENTGVPKSSSRSCNDAGAASQSWQQAAAEVLRRRASVAAAWKPALPTKLLRVPARPSPLKSGDRAAQTVSSVHRQRPPAALPARPADRMPQPAKLPECAKVRSHP